MGTYLDEWGRRYYNLNAKKLSNGLNHFLFYPWSI